MLLNAADATLEQRLSVPAPGMPPEPAEHVQRRVRTYHNQTLPAIQALEARGVLSRVDANGDADKTFAAFAAAYDTLAL
jgi:adenylate kinase family enzyme